MTLSEAVHHIEVADECACNEALSQLRIALGDGDIPARWGADPPLSLPGFFQFGSPPLFASDPVPSDPAYWSLVLILPAGDGVVIDQSVHAQGQSAPRRRQLFLLRSRVFELWPPSNHERKDRGSTTEPEKPLRRSVDDDQIRTAARDIYRERKGDPPNKPTAEQLIRQRLGGGKRDDIRRILDEEEFANLRREAGNQSKNPNLRNS